MARVQLSFVDLYCSESIACDHAMMQLKATIDGVEFDERAWYEKVTDPRSPLDMCREARGAAGLLMGRIDCEACEATGQCDWVRKD